MPELTIPFTKCDDTDLGVDQPTAAAVSTYVLPKGGMYKIAAYGPAGFVGIKWRLGLTPLTNAEGSFLANGDQEIIYVNTIDSGAIANIGDPDNVNLQVIRAAGSTDDGTTNIVVAIIVHVAQQDPRGGYPP